MKNRHLRFVCMEWELVYC